MTKSFSPVWFIFFALLPLFLSIKSAAQIQWQHITNLTITGGTLQKYPNSTTAWNAGAISQSSFYGDGWIEFKFPVPKYAVMGLAVYNDNVNYTSINYGIFAHINGYIYIRESGYELPNIGKSKAIAITYSSTDLFRVERINDVIVYKKNGAIFYTSLIPSSGPLFVDCAFSLYGSTITVTNYFLGLTWTGSEDQEWNNPANWSLNRIPGSSDQVIIGSCTVCPTLANDVDIAALQLTYGELDLGSYLLTTESSSLNGGKINSDQGEIISENFLEIKDCVFTGIITLEKTGGVSNSNHGGNIFSPEIRIVNSSNNEWQLASQSENVTRIH